MAQPPGKGHDGLGSVLGDGDIDWSAIFAQDDEAFDQAGWDQFMTDQTAYTQGGDGSQAAQTFNQNSAAREYGATPGQQPSDQG